MHWLLPTPRVAITSFRHDDGRPHLLVRDDLLHPIANGNKLRKLDAMLPALVAQGATDVITCGGAQSSHATATACICAEQGLVAHLMLRGEPPKPVTGYTYLSTLLGEVTWVDRATYKQRPAMMRALADRLRGEGRQAAVIPEGGGRVEAMLGLVRLVEGLVEAIDTAGHDASQPWTLVVDSGTGTTAVGVALGIALLALPWHVDGVCLIRDAHEMFEAQRAELISAWLALALPNRADQAQAIDQSGLANTLVQQYREKAASLDDIGLPTSKPGPAPPPVSLPLTWHPRVMPRRFGKLLPEEVARCEVIARATGVLMDPIYTLAAVDHIAQMDDARRELAIQIHTGGTLNLMGVKARMARR